MQPIVIHCTTLFQTLLHLMGTIEQIASGHSIDGVDHDPSANIIFYAAHDTNILFLAELLDLKWVVEGWQPNHTPPMGILVFEVCGWAGFHCDYGIECFFSWPSLLL